MLEHLRGLTPTLAETYHRYYLHAAKVWMGMHLNAAPDGDEMRQGMYRRSRDAKFAQLYRSLRLSVDTDDELNPSD